MKCMYCGVRREQLTQCVQCRSFLCEPCLRDPETWKPQHLPCSSRPVEVGRVTVTIDDPMPAAEFEIEWP